MEAHIRVAWTADESRFVVADWSTLRIYRTADAGLVVSTGSPAMFGMFDLVPHGEHLIWITEEGTGALVKTLDGREIRPLPSSSERMVGSPPRRRPARHHRQKDASPCSSECRKRSKRANTA